MKKQRITESDAEWLLDWKAKVGGQNLKQLTHGWEDKENPPQFSQAAQEEKMRKAAEKRARRRQS